MNCILWKITYRGDSMKISQIFLNSKELGLGESFGKNLKMSKVAEWVGLRHKISRTEVKSLSNIVMEKSEETRFIRLYN